MLQTILLDIYKTIIAALCGEKTNQQISTRLGNETASTKSWRAIVHCSAKTSDKSIKSKYSGIKACQEANMVAGVSACRYGCLGYGDCVKVCSYDAITIEEGLAVVNYYKCVGCGACVKSTTKALVSMMSLILS